MQYEAEGKLELSDKQRRTGMFAYATKACRISEGAGAIGRSLKRFQMKDGDTVD